MKMCQDVGAKRPQALMQSVFPAARKQMIQPVLMARSSSHHQWDHPRALYLHFVSKMWCNHTHAHHLFITKERNKDDIVPFILAPTTHKYWIIVILKRCAIHIKPPPFDSYCLFSVHYLPELKVYENIWYHFWCKVIMFSFKTSRVICIVVQIFLTELYTAQQES